MSTPDREASGSQSQKIAKQLNHETNAIIAMRNKPLNSPVYSTFHYDELPRRRGTIRILELLSSRQLGSDVECILHTPSSPEERAQYPYEALSWCWGTADKDAYIRMRIPNKLTTYEKRVNPNLVAALKALRYPNRNRYLWIDMICIDQEQ
jgi:hypothetical protein